MMDGFRERYAEPLVQEAQARPHLAPDLAANEEPEEVAAAVTFNSHFHLDRTRRKLHFGADTSVSDIATAIPDEPKDYLVKVSGGVVVYCDPETYPSDDEIRSLTEENFNVVVGAHPKRILSPEDKSCSICLLSLELCGWGK